MHKVQITLSIICVTLIVLLAALSIRSIYYVDQIWFSDKSNNSIAITSRQARLLIYWRDYPQSNNRNDRTVAPMARSTSLSTPLAKR